MKPQSFYQTSDIDCCPLCRMMEQAQPRRDEMMSRRPSPTEIMGRIRDAEACGNAVEADRLYVLYWEAVDHCREDNNRLNQQVRERLAREAEATRND